MTVAVMKKARIAPRLFRETGVSDYFTLKSFVATDLPSSETSTL